MFDTINYNMNIFLISAYQKKISITLLLIFLNFMSYSQKNSKEFTNTLKSSSVLSKYLENSNELGIQIIFTKINRKTEKKLDFDTQYYNVNKEQYFYPASTVKLPAVLLAIEKLYQLGLSIDSPMFIGSAFTGHEAVNADSSSQNNFASVAHYAKKILLVSDNDAFNRLYDFIGQKDFNESLHKKGYKSARILHRLQVPYNIEDNKRSPEVRFGSLDSIHKLDENQVVVPFRNNTEINYSSKYKILRGNAYFKNNELISEPFEFTHKNEWSLEDQHQLLKSIIFPNEVPSKFRFNIREEDRTFLLKYMSMYPRESEYPKYDSKEYYESYVKFLMFGDSKNPIPEHIRIFNKVGDAYGYLIDNAYFKDSKNNIEFLLSAVIYCNSDGVFNDDKYDYDKIGFPFMAELGRFIYEKELQRNKKGSN
jgi:hypothetical protein